jgi:crotonobetainyl-CoA:carnitine CoA-transferase CaiB-like acyl-CoA transferase
MAITGPVEGPPYKVGIALVDVLTGLYAAVAVLACLQARERSGHGYTIDLALLDCAIAAQVNVLQAFLCSGQVPPRQGNAHLQIVPYQLFATADGWMVLAVGNDGQWRRFASVAGRPDLAEDARFRTNNLRVEHRQILLPILEELLRSRTTAEWRAALEAAEVAHAPLWDYAELFAQPQAAARGWRLQVRDPAGRPVDLIGPPFHIGGAELPAPIAPPALGQDTDAVLRDLLGLDAGQLAELRRKGIV